MPRKRKISPLEYECFNCHLLFNEQRNLTRHQKENYRCNKVRAEALAYFNHYSSSSSSASMNPLSASMNPSYSSSRNLQCSPISPLNHLPSPNSSPMDLTYGRMNKKVKKSGHYTITRDILPNIPETLVIPLNASSFSYNHNPSDNASENSDGTGMCDEDYRELDFTTEKALKDIENGVPYETFCITNVNVLNPGPENHIYLGKQSTLYKNTFGIECLQCTSFEEMVAILQRNYRIIADRESFRIQQQILYQHIRKMNISQQNSNVLLTIINGFKLENPLPVDVRTLASSEYNDIDHYDVAIIEIEWIAS